MGLDVSTHLILGTQIRQQTFYKDVTKYDEDTGQPRRVRVPEKGYEQVSTGHRLVYDGDESWDYAIEDYEFCVFYDSDDDRFLGLEIVGTESHRHGSPWFELPEITPEQIQKATELLQKFSCEGPPVAYVVTSFSY